MYIYIHIYIFTGIICYSVLYVAEVSVLPSFQLTAPSTCSCKAGRPAGFELRRPDCMFVIYVHRVFICFFIFL